ncbi:lysophospholipase [Schlegelella sp. S2-27]|uniref:Lysophospholipase n=1 Tax=Caldimonas mangrovi TaxID=2944811 RepID=A0ABT0YL96_9BURK|nr:alpha/beta hydrolase [Caldimonas mangrovi]MCM5679184.1 lysophospholipase [Caldimonas mangrovi]
MNPLAVTPISSLAELTVADGTQLALRAWPAPETPARAAVLIVHGLGEHSGRYEHVAQRLRSWGFAVTGYDHRGHGRSQGPRGGLRHPHDLLSDLAAVVDHLRAQGAAPLLLLGHSMGGLVVGRFVADALRPVDGLVMSSPALDIGLSALNRGLLAASHALAPNLQVPNGLNPTFVSHDEAVVKAYVDDPLVHDKVTARLVRFMVEGGVRVRERAGQWSVPTLLIWAGADRLVAPAGSAAFAERAPAGVAHCHRFDHMYHEIFNEPDNEAVFDVLKHWLDRRFPGQAR